MNLEKFLDLNTKESFSDNEINEGVKEFFTGITSKFVSLSHQEQQKVVEDHESWAAKLRKIWKLCGWGWNWSRYYHSA